ncbi:chromate efflux transporter [Ureibacillus sinduriensis]|uniref:ChrA protein n=1 Tax=Ureibacillus sinduriensis BLB-1 = JCM 15800 TaxID=1384057 RepID=A0A0A3IKJ3_9BACL|nr:chromate efflux transporter [Ureibacillus sinduriensis]KGR75362.1 ChrA protein [Ureibacillus sinduriensis BLB-1 = JCM 15800]
MSLKSLIEILKVSTRLGLTSFGGPTAHLGYFHEEYILRKKWLDEKTYADLVALCQFLPGPASSQVGIGIGVMRGGILGGIISFLGFTMPSVIALIIFALLVQGLDVADAGWIHGLKIVAVAVVAHAILGMAKNLTPDLSRKALAILAIAVVLLWKTTFAQVGIILLAGVVGYFLFKQNNEEETSGLSFPITKKVGVFCITLFFGLLIVLPVLREITSSRLVAMFDSFYRAGSLVFGGGHVVLPLLEREFVTTGLISEESFLAGYGATQAVPGPMFTFAAYIGTIMDGWLGGLLATVAIFLPAFLLVFGTLPFWNALRKNGKMKGAFMGMNAAVVGILISALYDPIFTSAVVKPVDFVFAVVLFSMLAYWRVAPWIVVILGVVGGVILSLL